MTLNEFNNPLNKVFRITNNSMNDGTASSIPCGAEILAEQYVVEYGPTIPIDDNLFVVVSKAGAMLTQITEHNQSEGYIKCHYYNRAHQDHIVPLSDVSQLFIYRKIVSMRPPISAITGQPYEAGMVVSTSQSINSKGIVVDIVKQERYYLNEGTPDQTRWIYEEYSDGSNSHTLSPEDRQKLETEFPC